MEKLIGCQVELFSPWRGYRYGTIIGLYDGKYEIELESGAVVYCCKCEFSIG